MNDLTQRRSSSAWRSPPPLPVEASRAARRAFTLIELILVMTLLLIAVSLTAPALANFFRGRALDSEARRLLALTRLGQSRAVSEGVPVELWIAPSGNTFGLEIEPAFEPEDPRAEIFTLDAALRIEVDNRVAGNAHPRLDLAASAADPGLSRHPGWPRIRFLPDGGFDENSPPALRLSGREGGELWLTQSRNHLSYELRARPD